jgi:hypothetical protein
MIANVYLTDTDGLTFTPWDGTQAELDQRLAAKQVVAVNLTHGTTPPNLADMDEDVVLDLCERVYNIGNGEPSFFDEHAANTWRACRVRSISVGDVITIPGHGHYVVDRAGFVAASKALRAIA